MTEHKNYPKKEGNHSVYREINKLTQKKIFGDILYYVLLLCGL